MFWGFEEFEECKSLKYLNNCLKFLQQNYPTNMPFMLYMLNDFSIFSTLKIRCKPKLCKY